jgi:hypothetical protein
VPLWVVIGIVLWVVVCVAVVALCVSTRRIDEGLGRRASRRPVARSDERRPTANVK